MTGQDWVVVIPVLLLLAPLGLEMFDRVNGRNARVARAISAPERVPSQTLQSGGYAAAGSRR